MKQIIIARKDLNMSPGKLAAQVSHASMAFLTREIREEAKKVLVSPITQFKSFERKTTINGSGIETIDLDKPAPYRREDLAKWAEEAFNRGERYFYCRPADPNYPYGNLELCEPEYKYISVITFDSETYEQWIEGTFTKIVCEAKNKSDLMRAVDVAGGLDLVPDKDFFLIKDNCHTELTPEEVDKDGVGRTLTCIGFRPLDDEAANKIGKKYQLYK